MLEQRSAEKERALQNEVVASNGGGVSSTLQNDAMGMKPGMKRERERFKRLLFFGGVSLCVKFRGVYLSANFMSFPFSDFI